MLRKKERFDTRPKLLDVVELLADASEPACEPWGGSVRAGALGTVVEVLEDGFYMVEFGGEGAGTPSILTLPAHSVVLHEPAP